MTAPFTQEEIQAIKESIFDSTTDDIKQEIMKHLHEIRKYPVFIDQALKSIAADITAASTFDLFAHRISDITVAMYLGYLIGIRQAEAKKMEEMFKS